MAIDGTPADAVRMALLALKLEPAWVISGINRGGNLGTDLIMSGTVAAAREAVLLGRPAIAISQYNDPNVPLDWKAATGLATIVLTELLDRPIPRNAFWNVNLPAVAFRNGVAAQRIFCPVDPSPIGAQYRQIDGCWQYVSRYHERPRQRRHDVDICFAGNVSISRVPVK